MQLHFADAAYINENETDKSAWYKNISLVRLAKAGAQAIDTANRSLEWWDTSLAEV